MSQSGYADLFTTFSDPVNLPLRDVEILDMFKEFVKTKMKEPESEDIPPLRLPEITQENNDLSDINSDHDSIQSHYSRSASRERTSSPRLVSKKINERSKSSSSLRSDSRCSSPDRDEDIRMPRYLKSTDLPDDLRKALRVSEFSLLSLYLYTY